MAEEKAPAAAAPAKDKGKEADPKKVERSKQSRPKFPDDHVIVLRTDKENKKFGPDNNPKRGKAADRFAKYRDGMTVAQAIKAGVTQADLHWDKDSKGYIDVRPA